MLGKASLYSSLVSIQALVKFFGKIDILTKGSGKKVLFLVARPLRGGGKAWPLRKTNFFKGRKKSTKNVATMLEGGGVRP